MRLRETHHARTATLAQGRALRNQLAALLRGSLGLESDRLSRSASRRGGATPAAAWPPPRQRPTGRR